MLVREATLRTAYKRATQLLGILLLALLLLPISTDAQISRPVRIMPLGDSLTSSVDGQASYRYWLWKKLVASGFRVDFVGTQWGVGSGVSAPNGGFDADHEGHPGGTTDEIKANIVNWARETRPDVVLLLVGATDLERGFKPGYALQNSIRIINRLRAVNPYIHIVWAMLPPAPDQLAEARAYNAGVLRYATALSLPHSPIRVVNLWSNFKPASDTIDGDHPNATGERKFANRFFIGLYSSLIQSRGY